MGAETGILVPMKSITYAVVPTASNLRDHALARFGRVQYQCTTPPIPSSLPVHVVEDESQMARLLPCLVMAFLTGLSFSSPACSPPAGGFRSPSVSEAYERAPVALEGTVVSSSVENGEWLVHVQVTRWLKGEGATELTLRGFSEHVVTGASCPPSGRDVIVGKRHLLLLASDLAGNTGRAFLETDQASWVLN